jgi:hypothetical protein
MKIFPRRLKELLSLLNEPLYGRREGFVSFDLWRIIFLWLMIAGCASLDGPSPRPIDRHLYSKLEAQRDRADTLLRDLEAKSRNLESSCRSMAIKLVEDEINKMPALRELKVTGQLRPNPDYTEDENKEAEKIFRGMLTDIYDIHEDVTAECVQKESQKIEQTKRKLLETRAEIIKALGRFYPR